MAKLYTSRSGREVQAHSYSAGAEFRKCKRLYKLHRLDGFKEKTNNAYFQFGKAVEDAIQYYHANGFKADDCVDEFKRIWLKWEAIDLKYTDQEQDWKTCYGMGADMCRVYEIRHFKLPLSNAKFQLNYEKSLWPGTELSDLKYTAYLDMLCTSAGGDRLIVDIKTAKSSLTASSTHLGLDPQLRRYSWVTNYPDVAFLWFVKSKPSVMKGDTVTLLVDSGEWSAGDELMAYKYDKEADAVVAGLEEIIQKLDEDKEQIKGKGSGELKEALTAAYVSEGKLVVLARSSVVKVRLQFVQGKVDPKDFAEIGQEIGYEIQGIRYSDKENFWPKEGSVRGMDTKCLYCIMRGHCLDRPDLVDKLLVQISPAAKPEPDWLDVEVE